MLAALKFKGIATPVQLVLLSLQLLLTCLLMQREGKRQPRRNLAAERSLLVQRRMFAPRRCTAQPSSGASTQQQASGASAGAVLQSHPACRNRLPVAHGGAAAHAALLRCCGAALHGLAAADGCGGGGGGEQQEAATTPSCRSRCT